jgi:hypothetical protein
VLPSPHEQRRGEERQRQPGRALTLKEALREPVAARDLEEVVGAVRADDRVRVGEQQPADLDDGGERDRTGDQDAIDAAAETAARERHHEVDEREEVDVLECRPERERKRIAGIGEERREPGEADEDHDGTEPVLGAVAPRHEPAADVGPPHEQGHCGRCPGRRRLAVAADDERRHAGAGRRADRRHDRLAHGR